MTKALAKKADTKALALTFGEDEVKLIKETKCPDSTDTEFRLFIYDAAGRGLNPLKNEIYFVKRQAWNPVTKKKEGKASHQVGIDGFRIIALRSGEYKGQTKVAYAADITYLDVIAPEWAEVGVYRTGFAEPLYARAYFKEYVQSSTYEGKTKVGNVWLKMPRLMLAKCAEALALRKAFPDFLSGLYTSDEMSQADAPVDKKGAIDGHVVDAEDMITKETLDELVKAWSAYWATTKKDENISHKSFMQILKKKFNQSSPEVLTEEEAKAFIKQIKELEGLNLNNKEPSAPKEAETPPAPIDPTTPIKTETSKELFEIWNKYVVKTGKTQSSGMKVLELTLVKRYGKKSTSKLTEAEALQFIDSVKKHLAKPSAKAEEDLQREKELDAKLS